MIDAGDLVKFVGMSEDDFLYADAYNGMAEFIGSYGTVIEVYDDDVLVDFGEERWYIRPYDLQLILDGKKKNEAR